MKFILKNKLYDTDTAKEIAYVDNGYLNDDFRYFIRIKKEGKYYGTKIFKM